MPPNTSALASPRSERAPPASAWETCSASSSVEGQFARLIFGFAVTEALGIFALLIALLLLFVV
jgi:F0F1-type ATP synthase membrane subunit c/vacuolar-type H+-ATPase subunit K